MRGFLLQIVSLVLRILSFFPFLDNLVFSAIKRSHFSQFWIRYANRLTKAFQKTYNAVNANRKQKNIRLKNGLEFFVDVTDSSGWFLYCYQRYTEKKTQEFILENLISDSVFFDVGANIGYFSLLAGKKIVADHHIVVFEPNPNLIKSIEASAELNGLFSKILIENRIVTDRGGDKIRLYLSGNINSHNSTIVPEIQSKAGRIYDHFIEADTITIDDFCMENKIFPDLIKIDVEGAEELVLKGMTRILEDHPPRHIIIETSLENPVFSILGKAGYMSRELELFDFKNQFGNYLFYRV